MEQAISGFAQKVLRYFLTFLETDFKRQQAPKRRIHLKTDTGFRCGIPLRKYPKLYESVWGFAGRIIGEGLTLRIPRGHYIAPISQTLRDLIRQHVASLPTENFDKVRSDAVSFAKRNRGRAVDNPEKYVEDVQLSFVESVGQRIVGPVLSFLDGPFRQQSYSAIESVYEVESDLIDMLTAPAVSQLPTAINTGIVTGDFASVQKVLEDFFWGKEIQERITAFFEDFATADVFQELRDLANYQRSTDNLQFYLYLCEMRFGTGSYPLFYIPANARFDETKAEYVLEFDPHLFVNKRAVDYIVQESRGETNRVPISPVEDRIIYLDESKSFLMEMDKVLSKLIPAFELAGDIDLRLKRLQTVSSPNLKMSNSAYLAVFDKSDEALLNDYEEMLAAFNENQKAAAELFENIIRSFLLDEPQSVREQIEEQWETTPIPDRLVAMSPIPVNEEQRKILNALRDENCRYIAIQGPPGTGKSHTITAIAFDCILDGKNVLMLSDKQEALDVVQDKLESALATVRHGGDDFPNPILRLGRTGGSYNRLISQVSQERIRQHYRAHHTNAAQLDAETKKTHDELKHAIEKTVQAYEQATVPEIEELHRLELEIEQKLSGYSVRLQNPLKPLILPHLLNAGLASATPGWAQAVEYISQKFKTGLFDDLIVTTQRYSAAIQAASWRQQRGALSLFDSIGPSHQKTLVGFISEYENLRMPLLGFLFRSSKVRALNAKIGEQLHCTNYLDLHRRLQDLHVVVAALGRIREVLEIENLDETHGEAVYRLLLFRDDFPMGILDIKKFILAYRDIFGTAASEKKDRFTVGGDKFRTAGDLFAFLLKSMRYAELWHKVMSALESVPSFDYVGIKTKLEQLYTSLMTKEIDRRFLDFIDNNRTTAKTLGGVIKAKQQFPQDKFEGVKQAFPCIIAGIREFAEYVPLKHAIFDVVVIDEASQVSVAQAFPALLRAKKVIVFGDQKQFSNVKSAQASKMLNAGYLTDIEAYFRKKIATAADKIQRLKQFDVKKSILEFFDLIASYSDMLRKHFRGYQELISFSSKYFYDDQLQAIKVRGKPIDEVIHFAMLEHDGRQERYRNVNSLEADFILNELKRMVDEEEGMTVGVITPFREQQQLLSRLLFGDSYAEKFESELKLKVMTFDTCQGEERDVIFYSMVATSAHDVLNYVFPVDIEAAAERVEEALKAQRLNVGFSRAKECIHFVLSKPVEQFRGSVARAIMHYRNVLEEKSLPEAEDTDQASPMERKVLDWIQKTQFFQKHEDRLELIAQFPIGDYLRQLDPYYQHPAYRCDFLLRHYGEERTTNIIIEYDGFAEHFVEHGQIHEGNYDQYYRPEDIERQMVIESYGYKFLRLNRFNLGRDPITTLSKRLFDLINSTSTGQEPEAVVRIRQTAENLAHGDAKHCRKCGKVKPVKAFFDPRLQGGKGGQGQICMDCKRGKVAGLSGKRQKRWRKRY